jgi:hypothetical protein
LNINHCKKVRARPVQMVAFAGLKLILQGLRGH